MKAQDLFLIAGVAFVGYWLIKKTPKVIDSTSDVFKNDKEEPKTIVLNLRETPKKGNFFYEDSFVRDFNTSKFSTVAPPMVVVKQNS
jgi:hypothetical protein